MKKRTHKLFTGVLGGLLVSGLAFAPAASAALPDDTQTGTINISKRDASHVGAQGDGTQLTGDAYAALGAPVADVEFTVRQVTHVDGEEVDLLTRAGWELVVDLTLAEVLAGTDVTLGAPRVAVTDAAGSAVFADLPLGLWLVQETAAPTGIVPAVPFLVTLPMTNPAGDGWMYEIFAYPKNDTVALTKTVDDSAAFILGDAFSWTLTADIPRGEHPVTAYVIVDVLDERLDFVSASVELSDDTALVAGTHYVLVEVGQEVRVVLTQAGLDLINAVRNETPAVTVVVELVTEVNAVGDGYITNQAWLLPDGPAVDYAFGGADPTDPDNPMTDPDPEDPADPFVPSNPETTRWGNVVVAKTDAQDALLAGAVFRVYLSYASARAGEDHVVIDGVYEWTTGADGRVVIDGLRASAGAGVRPHAGFWLVEVQAPAGFELLAAPVHVHVYNANTTAVDVTVVNVPHNVGFRLPMTGGEGAVAWGLIALVVAVAGGAVFVVRRRVAGASA